LASILVNELRRITGCLAFFKISLHRFYICWSDAIFLYPLM